MHNAEYNLHLESKRQQITLTLLQTDQTQISNTPS